MTKHCKTILFTCMLILGLGSYCCATDVILVTSNANPLSSITRRTAQLIFQGKKTKWMNGEHIAVLVNNQQDVYSAFCKKILKKTPKQYLIYRKKMLFTGSGIPPLVEKDDDAVKTFLSQVKNGISFIDRKSLDSKVKELKIE